MKPSPLLLMLDALLGLVEQQLDREPADPATDLPLIGAELQRLTALLIRLTERSATHHRDEISPPIVDAIVAARRLRAEHFGREVGDAAWTLLLILFGAWLQSHFHSATYLARAAGLHLSTALRWLHRLEGCGWVTWQMDPADVRTARIGLSETGAARVETYLRTALRVSRLVS